MRKGVLIAGYYGAGNTGDEAILSGMISSLKSEGIKDITVLSRNPEETRVLHGVEYFADAGLTVWFPLYAPQPPYFRGTLQTTLPCCPYY